MIFRRLRISNWRQFRDLDLKFHGRLTVLTGANGAGKTTVLNLLSRHFGWQGILAGTTTADEESIRIFFRLSGGSPFVAVTYFALWAVRLAGFLPDLRVSPESKQLTKKCNKRQSTNNHIRLL